MKLPDRLTRWLFGSLRVFPYHWATTDDPEADRLVQWAAKIAGWEP